MTFVIPWKFMLRIFIGKAWGNEPASAVVDDERVFELPHLKEGVGLQRKSFRVVGVAEAEAVLSLGGVLKGGLVVAEDQTDPASHQETLKKSFGLKVVESEANFLVLCDQTSTYPHWMTKKFSISRRWPSHTQSVFLLLKAHLFIEPINRNNWTTIQRFQSLRGQCFYLVL